MSTQPPLDLDAIRERIRDGKAISVPEVAAAEMHALISEVEALRNSLAFTERGLIKEVAILRAKLEMAKQAMEEADNCADFSYAQSARDHLTS
jgi:hypothetical protein